MGVKDTGAKRTHDLPGENKPFKPQKQSATWAGFTSQVAGLMTDDIMQRAVKDRTAQALAEATGETFDFSAAADTQDTAENADREEDEDRDGGATREEDDLEVLRARRREQMKKAH